MSKPIIRLVASNYDVTSTNINFEAIATYIEENLLHRNGEVVSSPMNQGLDLNGHKVTNLGFATAASHAVPLEQFVQIQAGDLSSITDIDFTE